jgi:serine/threonine protein kinase
MEAGFQAGTILLGKYRIESVVGRGGMGVVLRVTHLQLDEELAIKVLLPEATSPEGHARFLREAQSVVRLRGEHVTRVIDVGILPDGVPYMFSSVMRSSATSPT